MLILVENEKKQWKKKKLFLMAYRKEFTCIIPLHTHTYTYTNTRTERDTGCENIEAKSNE